MVAADIMSRNVVTIRADAPLAEIADLFRRHRFTCLPVIGPDSDFLGVIFQMHLIDQAGRDASRNFRSAMRHMMERAGDAALRAADIMVANGPRATASTPVAALLPLMADGEVDAVPVLEGDRIIGIVTRTDLISALARSTLSKG